MHDHEYITVLSTFPTHACKPAVGIHYATRAKDFSGGLLSSELFLVSLMSLYFHMRKVL